MSENTDFYERGRIQFDEISLLITHYNRSYSLERLLKSFEDLNMIFKEIVVSDDGSREEHLVLLRQLKTRFGFRLICSEKNKGLGNNINKGQHAVTAPYTLYVQEDFIPRASFRQRLVDGFELIKEDPEIDIVRFYAYEKHPYLEPIRNGFSEMKFYFWRPSYWQFHCYSDHPHLKRSTFLRKFGDYAENVHSDKTEYKMSVIFLRKRGKAIIHEDYKNIFAQINSPDEPSVIVRKNLRTSIQSKDSFWIKLVRIIYRNIKARVRYIFW